MERRDHRRTYGRSMSAALYICGRSGKKQNHWHRLCRRLPESIRCRHGICHWLLYGKRYIRFDLPHTLKEKLLRLIIGLAAALLLQQGLKPVLGSSLWASFFRYFLVVAWILMFYPLLFSKIPKAAKQQFLRKTWMSSFLLYILFWNKKHCLGSGLPSRQCFCFSATHDRIIDYLNIFQCWTLQLPHLLHLQKE